MGVNKELFEQIISQMDEDYKNQRNTSCFVCNKDLSNVNCVLAREGDISCMKHLELERSGWELILI